MRATLTSAVATGVSILALAGASGIASAQTPTATSQPLAACPTGTLTVAAPTAAAPSTVSVTIAPPLANLKAASAGDRASHHVHYFIDTPAPAAGTLIPTGNASIIHSGTLTQDLGTLAAGSHTVVVVVGQLDHRACDLRGQVTFTTSAAGAAAVTPPKTGNGGLLEGAATSTSGLSLAALAATAVVAAGGGAALARRRR